MVCLLFFVSIISRFQKCCFPWHHPHFPCSSLPPCSRSPPATVSSPASALPSRLSRTLTGANLQRIPGTKNFRSGFFQRRHLPWGVSSSPKFHYQEKQGVPNYHWEVLDFETMSKKMHNGFLSAQIKWKMKHMSFSFLAGMWRTSSTPPPPAWPTSSSKTTWDSSRSSSSGSFPSSEQLVLTTSTCEWVRIGDEIVQDPKANLSKLEMTL